MEEGKLGTRGSENVERFVSVAATGWPNKRFTTSMGDGESSQYSNRLRLISLHETCHLLYCIRVVILLSPQVVYTPTQCAKGMPRPI